jgi:DNA-binding MarR family transcriptional regulator
MDVSEVTSVDPCAPAAALDRERPLEQVCESIWGLIDAVLELLRSHSNNQVRIQKGPGVLWLDDLTPAQRNTLVAIKNLCDVYPKGVTLTRLAEAIGVSPAAASVMVDVLVAKKTIKRARAQNDRRAIRVRLTPQTSQLFAISVQSLTDAVIGIADVVGEETLRDLQKNLAVISEALKAELPVSTCADATTPVLALDGGGDHDNDED